MNLFLYFVHLFSLFYNHKIYFMQVKINFIQHKIYFYDYQAGSTKIALRKIQSQCVFHLVYILQTVAEILAELVHEFGRPV